MGSDGTNAAIVLTVNVLLSPGVLVLLLICLPFHKRFRPPSVFSSAELPVVSSLIVIVCVLRFFIAASLAAILVVKSMISPVPVIELTLISSNVVVFPIGTPLNNSCDAASVCKVPLGKFILFVERLPMFALLAIKVLVNIVLL